MSFSHLGLTPSLCRPLARLGYQQPTPIQARAIPAVLTGTDLLARAQTGTGKTAAFGLPMIDRILARRDHARPRLFRGLVLVPTRELAAQVSRSLSTIKTAVLHGDKSQGARTRALGDFKAGRVNVLVATDIAARGLDIAQLPLVINYDLPLVAEDYIHRVGRTGRAGRSGRAVSLVSPSDSRLLHDIQRLSPAPIEPVTVQGFDAPPAAPSGDPSRRAGFHSAQRKTRHNRGQKSRYTGQAISLS